MTDLRTDPTTQGTTMPLTPHYRLLDLFWMRVEKTPNHWHWKGTTKNGYPWLDTRRLAETDWPPGIAQLKAITPARLIWELHFGDLARGQYVRTTCGVQVCVRPDHLEAYTRTPPNVGQISTTPDQDEEAIRLWLEGTLTQREIANRVGTSRTTIQRVLRDAGLQGVDSHL